MKCPNQLMNKYTCAGTEREYWNICQQDIILNCNVWSMWVQYLERSCAVRTEIIFLSQRIVNLEFSSPGNYNYSFIQCIRI